MYGLIVKENETPTPLFAYNYKEAMYWGRRIRDLGSSEVTVWKSNSLTCVAKFTNTKETKIMSNWEKALEAMHKKVAEFHSTNIKGIGCWNVSFPNGLQKGTEWAEGCDYSADYELYYDGFVGELIRTGTVYWSFASQEAYL